MAHVCQRLVELAAERPDHPALVAPDGTVRTFGDLLSRARALSGRLDAFGLPEGSHVLLLVPVGPFLYEALLGILWGGRTAVLVDPSVPAHRIDPALARVGLDGMIGVPRAHLLRFRLRSLRGLAVYAAPGFLGPFARSLSGSGPGVAPGPMREPPRGEPALITFTTGTTGIPKAMGRSHRFLLAQHRALASHMGLTGADVDLPTLPVFLLNTLAAGATSILPDGDLRDVAGFDPERLTRQVRAHGVTTSSGSPAFYRRWVDALRRRGEVLPSVQRLFVGGARVPLSLVEAMVEVFPNARVHVLYGSTEAEPMASIEAREILAETAERERAGEGTCVGRPVPGLRVRIVDPDTGEIRADGVGEILVAGPHVNQGYYRDPRAEHENKVRDGDVVWHRTGDAGRFDEKGRLWLVGRVSQRVCGAYPFPVEIRAEAVAGVVRAALIEVGGTAVLAYSGDADPQAVARAAGIEAEVRRVSEIPVDPRHRFKVDRQALRRILTAGP